MEMIHIPNYQTATEKVRAVFTCMKKVISFFIHFCRPEQSVAQYLAHSRCSINIYTELNNRILSKNKIRAFIFTNTHTHTHTHTHLHIL